MAGRVSVTDWRGAERKPGRLVPAIVLVILFSLLGIPWAVGADSPVSKEYQIKAAFLYNFTKFVEWTPQRFPEESSPIVIGILGKNPFGNELEGIVRGRTVNGREIVVKLTESPNQIPVAHVLFVAAGEERRFREVFTSGAGTGVLTVGDSEQTATLGAMINFTMEGNKVRFDINIGAAERAGLKISAQLQKLAKSVRKTN
jgi:hypothetical protein